MAVLFLPSASCFGNRIGLLKRSFDGHGRLKTNRSSASQTVMFDGYAPPAKGNQSFGHVDHRHSAGDFLHNVATIPHSSILREVKGPVLSLSVWATIVSLIHATMISSAIPLWKKLAGDMCIGTTTHSFLVNSLGLLLVFRTNSAYQKFVVSSSQSVLLYGKHAFDFEPAIDLR